MARKPFTQIAPATLRAAIENVLDDATDGPLLVTALGENLVAPEFDANETHLRWRVGDGEWQDLVALSDLGVAIISGEGTPTNEDGLDGQWYVDTEAGALFGPKASGEWPENPVIAPLSGSAIVALITAELDDGGDWQGGGGGAWGGITGTLSDQTDLQGALDSKASTSHTHAVNDLSDVSAGSPEDGQILVYRSSGPGYVLEAKPTSSGEPAWGEITGTLSNQTDLQGALDGKASTSHDHDGTYAPVEHGHTLSDISDAGDAAGLDVGTTAGTVAAGDDSRITTAVRSNTTQGGAGSVVIQNIVSISQEDYDALDPPDADTFYVVPEA